MRSLSGKLLRLRRLVFGLLGRIPKDGLAATWRQVRYRVHEEYREWRLGIRTTGFIPWNEITDNDLCENYEAISYECLDDALGHIEFDAKTSVLLDYGCGKGRVVIVAATRPVRRVVGIELSGELADVARQNVERARANLRCQDIEIHTGDATQFDVPDDVNIVFFFNPFLGELLTAVQGRVRESLLRRPRRMTIVYMHRTQHEDAFAGCSWLQQRCRLSTHGWEGVRFVVYETLPQGVELVSA